MSITIKLYTEPSHIYERIHNMVMLATVRVWLNTHRKRLQQLAQRLKQQRPHKATIT